MIEAVVHTKRNDYYVRRFNKAKRDSLIGLASVYKKYSSEKKYAYISICNMFYGYPVYIICHGRYTFTCGVLEQNVLHVLTRSAHILIGVNECGAQKKNSVNV